MLKRTTASQTSPITRLDAPTGAKTAPGVRAEKLETPLGPTEPRAKARGVLPPRGPLGQMLQSIQRGAKNVATGGAIMALAVGLAGCNLGSEPTEPRPYEPIREVSVDIGEGGVQVGTVGETRIAADLRIALHNHANAEHRGSRSGLFLHHAGEDRLLSATELAGMMEAAKVGSGDVQRFLGAKAAVALRDATGDQRLSWGEFKPVVFAPSELAEGK